MKNIITLQNNSGLLLPRREFFNLWAMRALFKKEGKITLRFVNQEESAQMNHTFRGKNNPTNVLSFPYENTYKKVLGDLLFCPSIVEQQAQEQNKTFFAHYAHLTIHGVLHLQGFDHENPNDALQMESTEIAILKKLGFANPYV